MTRTSLRGVLSWAAAAVLGLGLGVSAGAAKAEEPAFLALSAGAYDVNDDFTAGEFRAEYRFSEASKLWIFTPFIGVMATTDEAVYGYVGLGVDIPLGQRVVLIPSAAVGAYHDGDGKDLGHTVEFRTGLELAYRFDNRSRLGLAVHHISNAGLGDSNPGTESVVLTYSMPTDALFGR
ncbi:MAG: acyloxyacyl hydrolase [Alphaproteobacteria bacterium]|nr:acyloxyacyl hydrolase [Alphaproteobacteria bacterium]MBU0797292.1 acyloxyacyl hydrolase [Alphaproteobacteria bacterium]MBU0888920.1 acyloxyacyl hydrolase [Alphaproteobacteria bacterium]MBU1813940.1 acyloxyacyl hydrolase [Alphaproteobacteria bacterium]